MSYGNFTPDPVKQAHLRDQMERGIKILNSIIDSVTQAAEPFKKAATFVHSPGLRLAIVNLDGKQYRIREEYCYFVIGQTTPGQAVWVDFRYLTAVAA